MCNVKQDMVNKQKIDKTFWDIWELEIKTENAWEVKVEQIFALPKIENARKAKMNHASFFNAGINEAEALNLSCFLHWKQARSWIAGAVV